MNKLPEIQGWFVARNVPFGAAPEYIKEQWIGVPLPLRQMSPTEAPRVGIGHAIDDILSVHIVDEAVDVWVFDALKSLDIFERNEAREFWAKMLHPNQGLMFSACEGEVYSTPTIQRILPGIELFDEL